MAQLFILGFLLLCLLGCTAGQVRQADRTAGAVGPVAGAISPDTAPITQAIRDGFAGAAQAVQHKPDDHSLGLEEWLAILAGVGVSIAGGVATTNKIRDGRRVLRGEPTKPAPPT